MSLHHFDCDFVQRHRHCFDVGCACSPQGGDGPFAIPAAHLLLASFALVINGLSKKVREGMEVRHGREALYGGQN